MKNKQRREKLQERLKRVFVVPEFERRSNYHEILGKMPDYDKYLAAKEKVIKRRYEFVDLPVWMAPCYLEPILSRKQEYHVFRAMNFHKFIARNYLKNNDLARSERKVELAKDIQSFVAQCNFRLAVAAVKRNDGDAQIDEEKLSLAYECVMKVVDYFDYTRGYKFSTYATWSLRRELYNYWTQERRHDKMNYHPYDASIFARLYSGDNSKMRETTNVGLRKAFDKVLKSSQLDKRELFIIQGRFGLQGHKQQGLREIGNVLGISKERVRQLENRALGKLQQSQNLHLLKEYDEFFTL